MILISGNREVFGMIIDRVEDKFSRGEAVKDDNDYLP